MKTYTQKTYGTVKCDLCNNYVKRFAIDTGEIKFIYICEECLKKDYESCNLL